MTCGRDRHEPTGSGLAQEPQWVLGERNAHDVREHDQRAHPEKSARIRIWHSERCDAQGNIRDQADEFRHQQRYQAVVQSLGVKGRGKHWVVVTSQEKLGELVSGLDDKKIELARLMDRFPLQVHLEPSDISEVTSRRVLSKNAAAQTALGKLFDEHRGRLTEHSRLTADIKLP
jgi:hypothetical protein